MIDKLTTIEIEERVATYFGIRQNIIVPNISWGMNIHECDLLIVRKSGYAVEVEIKISRADLKKDLEKRHHHSDSRIRDFYFAIPEYLQDSISFIPEHAGIITLKRNYNWHGIIECKTIRNAKVNTHCQKFTTEEISNIARLGSMRIWNLKRKMIEMRRKRLKKKPSPKDQLILAI